MKSWLFLLPLLALSLAMQADYRNNQEAKVLALQYMGSHGTAASKAFQSSTLTEAYGSGGPFYIYNRGHNEGFVIVSADTRARTILGYSDKGAFCADSVPPQLSALLHYYSKQIAALDDETLTPSSGTISGSGNAQTAVSPMTDSIRWGQYSPYNQLCPLYPGTQSRTLTGCGATAMAIVMKYFHYPAQGQGTQSYSWLGQTLTRDFSQSSYDWSHMLKTYSSTYTQQQGQAVAQLMYDCGVAIKMDYSTSASGAYLSDIALALTDYMKYDESVSYLQHMYFTPGEWVDLFRHELSQHRPVIVGLANPSLGHAFVCDGFSSDSLFHFNWGWNGSMNGFFSLDAIFSIVGVPSNKYYIEDCVLHIQQPNDSLQPIYLITADTATVMSDSLLQRAETATGTFYIENWDFRNFSLRVGTALYTQDGSFVSLLHEEQDSLASNDCRVYKWPVAIPSSVPNGRYRLYNVFQLAGDTLWRQARGYMQQSDYLNVRITSDSVYYCSENSVVSGIHNVLSPQTQEIAMSYSPSGLTVHALRPTIRRVEVADMEGRVLCSRDVDHASDIVLTPNLGPQRACCVTVTTMDGHRTTRKLLIP